MTEGGGEIERVTDFTIDDAVGGEMALRGIIYSWKHFQNEIASSLILSPINMLLQYILCFFTTTVLFFNISCILFGIAAATYIPKDDVSMIAIISMLLVVESIKMFCLVSSVPIDTVLFFHVSLTITSVVLANKVDNQISNATSYCLVMLLIFEVIWIVVTLAIMRATQDCVADHAGFVSYQSLCSLVCCRSCRTTSLYTQLQSIQSFQSFQCPICLESEESNIVRLRCGHVFHQACIEGWLTNHETCPNCRADVI